MVHDNDNLLSNLSNYNGIFKWYFDVWLVVLIFITISDINWEKICLIQRSKRSPKYLIMS